MSTVPSNYTGSTPGADNAYTPSADEAENRKNFQMLYISTVYRAMQDKLIFTKNITKKTLAKGAKSAVFPFTGVKTARHLQRTEKIAGSALAFTQKVIELDDLMYSDSFIATVDTIMSNMDIIAENATADGEAIAKELEYQANIMINKSATLNHPIKNEDGSYRRGGSEIVLNAVGDEEDSEKLIQAFKLLAKDFAEKNVDVSECILAVTPAVFFTLLDSDKLININTSEGNGNYSTATLKGIFGFKLQMTNLIVDFNPSVEWVGKYTGLQSKYNHDCSKTIALAFNADAAGFLVARDIKMEEGYEMDAQGKMIVVSIFKGFDTLNPVGAGRILSA